MIVNVKIGDLYRSRSLAPDGHHTPCLDILMSVNTWILTLCNVHFQYIIVFCPCLLTHEWALGHRALACVSPRLYFTPESPPAVWWPSLWQSATKYLQTHIPHILVSIHYLWLESWSGPSPDRRPVAASSLMIYEIGFIPWCWAPRAHVSVSSFKLVFSQ